MSTSEITQMSKVNSAIILYLDKSLEIYELSFVNDTDKVLVKNIKLLDIILPGDKGLNLAQNFTSIWEKNMASKGGEHSYFFWTGPSTGFTDIRIVSIWIRSQNMFYNSAIYLLKVENYLNIFNVGNIVLENLVKTSLENFDKAISYVREPRIGLKD